MGRPRILERPIRFNLWLSEADRALLERLSERDEITPSDFIRRFIRTEAKKRLGWSPDAPLPKKKAK